MLTLKTTHLTRNELHDSFAASTGGDVVIYATGNLSADRDKAKKEQPHNYHAINLTAELALELAGYENRQGTGRVFNENKEMGCLTQKKLSLGIYEYRITK